jgi:hypothetical protein
VGVEEEFPIYLGCKISKAKLVVGLSGKMHTVSCKICSIVEHKEKLLVPKLDQLIKHNGRKK